VHGKKRHRGIAVGLCLTSGTPRMALPAYPLT
jgi:hypothetical protein